MRLGQIDEATRAYSFADQAKNPAAKERLIAAKVVQAAEIGASDREILAAVDDLDVQTVSCRPWLHMVTAVGLLLFGNTEAASAQIQLAEETGASSTTSRCLRALCSTFDGTPQHVAKTELAALPISPRTRAILGWLIGEGPIDERLNTLKGAFGNNWMVDCPINVDVAVHHMVASLCEAGRWDEIARLNQDQLRLSPALKDLFILVDLRHALWHAIRGELDDAQKQLATLQERVAQMDGR